MYINSQLNSFKNRLNFNNCFMIQKKKNVENKDLQKIENKQTFKVH